MQDGGPSLLKLRPTGVVEFKTEQQDPRTKLQIPRKISIIKSQILLLICVFNDC